MKFLIQKINGEICHDFVFALLESVRFNKWLTRNNKKDEIKIKYANTFEVLEPSDIYPMPFKPCHIKYVPVGSVDFVTDFLVHFYNIIPKPINVPVELFPFAERHIFNGTEKDLKGQGKSFVKSNDKIKFFTEIIPDDYILESGNYQISELITIDSEWRAFVFQGKLIGLQNYCGEFTKFPNVGILKDMIQAYKSAPVAYTLDIGVNDNTTFPIEIHDFFSIGLYGFNSSKYPTMLNQWFRQYIQREMVEQRRI